MIGERVLGFVPGDPGPERPFAILRNMPSQGTATASAQFATADDDDLRAVVERIVHGEEAALRELYDRSVGRIYGLALRITGRPDAAEEVASDVYLQVWRDAGRYDSARARVLTWLLTICRSRAIDFLRRREFAEPLPDDDQLAESHSAPGNDPQYLLSSTQSYRQLHAALAVLTPLQRQLLALAFFRGFTHEEVAQHACLPLGSVKTHIRKALAMLRATLAGENEEVRT